MLTRPRRLDHDHTPKVIGGITEACGEVARRGTKARIDTVHRVSSAEAAEMAKLWENTFRMINIASSMSWRSCVNVWAWMLGSDRRGCLQTFGFYEIHRGLSGRSLHSDRSALIFLEDEIFNYNARFIDWPPRSTRICRVTSSAV